MRFAPRVAMTVALVSLLAAPSKWSWAQASEPAPADAKPAAASQSKPADNAATAGNAGASTIGSANGAHANTTAAGSKSTATVNEDNDSQIDMRIGRMGDQVRMWHLEGRLSNDEADNYLSAINQVAEKQAENIALAGSVPPATELLLQLTLDHLEQSLCTSLHDRKVATLDIPGRIALMQMRLNAAEQEGRLTKADADGLRSQLKQLEEAHQGHFQIGKVDYGDALVVSMQLDKIVDQYGRSLQPRPFDVPNVKALESEVDQLQKKERKTGMDNIKLLSQQLNHSVLDTSKKPHAVGSDAALQYASQLEWLKALLTQDEAGKAVALDLTQAPAQIDKHIARALLTGRLSPAEAQQLSSDLSAVIAQQQSMSASGNPLNSPQQAQLALQFSRVNGRVAQGEHRPSRFWPGLDAAQAAFDQRRQDGVTAGRLTIDEAKALRAEADKLADTEKNYRGSDDGVTSKQALELVIGLQQLNVKLHRELKDRDVKAPDLDKLQAHLEKVVTEGVDLGKLDYNSKLVEKINHPNELKQQYANAPGGLDDRAKLAVAQDIQQQIAELHRAMHHDRSQPQQTLDMRISALTQQIAEAVATGVMTVERAAQYKAAVDTVYGSLLEARKTAGGMTPAQTLAIANDIDSLQDQLGDELRDDATLPQHLAPRMRELAAQIGRQLADGRISINEASELIAQLDHNAERLAAAASAQGGLSQGEGLRLGYELERISSRLESSLQDEPMKLADPTDKTAALDAKLAGALAAGKVSLSQSEQVRAQLESVLADKDEFQRSDNGMSYPETIALSRRMESINHDIDQLASAKAQTSDITTRRTDLEKQVKAALAAGKLSDKDAASLLDDLDRIAQSEANFRVSDEGLSFAEARTLALDLDRVSAKVDSMSKGQLSLKQKH